MLFVITLACIAAIAISTDGDGWTRTFAFTIMVVSFTAYCYHLIHVQSHQQNKTRSLVLAGLPHIKMTDSKVYGLDATPCQYSHLVKNQHILAALGNLATLRRHNDNTFAIACTYANTLLKASKKLLKTNEIKEQVTYLVFLKSRVLDTLQEFVTEVTPDFLDKMNYIAAMKALDVVLYTEAIGPLARTQDVYPMALYSNNEHVLHEP